MSKTSVTFFPHKKFPCVIDIFKIMILINILRVREWKGYIVVMLLYVKIKILLSESPFNLHNFREKA